MGLVTKSEAIRPYDFGRPHQLSRAQSDGVHGVMAGFWRSAANFLSTYLRTPVQLQQLSVHQMTYEDMIQSIHVPAVLATFTSDPLPGTAFLECSSTLALAMIDRALGGSQAQAVPSRRLSEIEEAIARRVLERILLLYTDAWNAITPVSAKVVSMEHNPSFAQIAGEGDLVLVARQQMMLDAVRGQMMFVWPYPSISPLGEAAARVRQVREGPPETIAPPTQEMLRHVEALPVRAEAILGRTELTLGEFDRLEVGDAIVLKNRFDQPLTLRLSDKEKFVVLPGRVGGRLAVRVISRKED